MAEDPPRTAPPFAARYGLVRPLQGRYVAGVCAALGRATHTDPVLWRVILAVLVCAGGIGALGYLVLWLMTPEEGDTASPVEALFGRGYSNTSPILVILLGVVAGALLVFLFGRPLYLVLLAGLILAVLLLQARTRGQPASTDPAAAPAGPPWEPLAPPAPSQGSLAAPGPLAPPHGPLAAPQGPLAPDLEPPAPPPEPMGSPPTSPAAPTEPPPRSYAERLARSDRPAPPLSLAPIPDRGDRDGGYRAPFAPHGPFAGVTAPPPPPPPRRERSRLGAFTIFGLLLVLGLMAVLDAAGAWGVPTAGYLATALAVVGAGLLVGAWLGRARLLIALGVVLALALPVAHVFDTWQRPQYYGDVTWAPTSPAQLQDEYSLMLGSGLLDLRGVDMSGREEEVTVQVMLGEVRIIVPADVAVEATVDTRLGDAQVFGFHSEGVSQDTINDPGSGDPDDGVLRLNLEVRLGAMEVHR